MTVQSVAYGTIPDMIAEVSALDMGDEWFAETGYKYCVMVIGDAQHDTSFFKTLADARTEAKYQAKYFGVKAWRV